MNLALVGTGQMGQTVAEVAAAQGHEVGVHFDSERPFLNADRPVLQDVDVAIDFSLPSLAVPHLRRYCEWQLPAVVGTTGWYDELDDVRQLVVKNEASVLYAPNFSIGVAVLSRALDTVARLMDQLEDYDAFVRETHHTKKVDSPSGTARMLGEQILSALERKEYLDPETQHERIDPAALHVTSTRTGTVVGQHTVGFDSPYDQISLNHEAKNRRGFAVGTVRSAEWLLGRTGLYTLDDVLDDWLSEDSPTSGRH